MEGNHISSAQPSASPLPQPPDSGSSISHSNSLADPTFNSGSQDLSFSNLDDYAQQEQQQQHQHQHQLRLQQLNGVPDSTTYLHTGAGLSPNGSGQGSAQVSPGATGTTTGFPPFDFNQQDFKFDQNTPLDPSLLGDFDPSSLDLLSAPNANGINPMATTMQSHSTTPPHLMNNYRPRTTSDSLTPASAMFPSNEWSNMYKGHHRSPSDNISEYSSHSNQASPYLSNLDTFDNSHASPLLNPSHDTAVNNDFGMQHFTLSDPASSGHSPGHSPHISPQQQALPPFMADSFGLQQGLNGNFAQSDMDLFSANGQEAFPLMNVQTDFAGAADTMSPPEINIDYAPESKVPVEVARPAHTEDSLSPPLRSPNRSRTRAKSDSYAGSRPPTPGIPARGRSPSLQPNAAAQDTLSPFDNNSRSPSPARGRDGSIGSNRRVRSSSNTSDQRDYILDLANPERTPSNGADNRRVQKHPATFQCTLCPKKFTRAYNLRSHLRTHTDERPFVCTVCGKAFARQHDRKRHEGLHSGEKKFVCRGTLQSGPQWGCGRKFARADALGRHFRSEAGRICIKPLLDEEAAERQRAWMEEQQQAQVAAGMANPQPMLNPSQMDVMTSFLPAALLQQYPALAGIDWSAMPQGPPPDDEYGGRSSFEAGASSGGEFYDDMSENEMGGFSQPLHDNGRDMNMDMQHGQHQSQMGIYPDAGRSNYMT